MEVQTASRAIRRRWWIVALITGAMAALAGALTMLSTPTYTATAEGLVTIRAPQTRQPYALANGSQYILDRMTSYAQLGVTTPVLAPVVSELRLPDTPLTLSNWVESRSVENTTILEVSAKYNDPAVAAHIADATLRQLVQTIENVDGSYVEVRAVGEAAIPSAPSNRNLVVNAGIGAAAGLFVGLAVTVGLGVISDRARWQRALASGEITPTT